MTVDYVAEAAALLPELQDLRRRLHAEPETGLDLPGTQAKVLEALEPLRESAGLEITLGKGLSSVTAVLRGTHPDRPADSAAGASAAEAATATAPAVLLRGDMDGLPVTELTDEPFKSLNGNMHACGHDLHTSGLVGAARLLAAHRDQLPGDVVFMFQPGEEDPGGAPIMIEEGVLEAAGPRVVAAFGVHVEVREAGILHTKPGILQSGSNILHVTINGAGGHGSKPYESRDPVPALAELVLALQNMVSRRFDVFDPVVMSVTQLSAGDAVNVIPASATLGATIRVFSAEALATMQTEVDRLAAGIAAAHGCTAKVDFQVKYPVTVNDEAETVWAMDQVRGLLGEARMRTLADPVMPSEDFSYVLDEVPGTYMMLGAKRADVPEDKQADNHSPYVVFDDSVLGDQAAVLAHLATQRLRAEVAQGCVEAAQG
ncbi:M20 family metallopeptidase [Brevibacterium sp. 91QC2O2]|jgi:amidohydrolase|uniref:M20 metallopeptidase family protein n=1 Tax=Brevibacterium sp. 91QC2O2 TaxID=2968458 RepID=UPI00211BDE5C|nr:M20 family metallopeptidase [Brevibacterium sp. 91QC2O2]MCQ9369514.1 M20 family metallopeptidase [Brevibacterium sp. 91QC2O2]